MLHWNSPGGHERLAVAQKRLAQEGRTGPEAQRKIREDHDYIFHDDERYQRAAKEGEAAQQGGGQGGVA